MNKARRVVWIIIVGLNLLWTDTAVSQSISTLKIDLEVKNKSLKEVFQLIEQKSGLHFIYNDNLVSAYTNISYSGTGRIISFILNELLNKTNLTYIEQNNRIIIEKKNTIPPDPPEPKIITGKILEAGTDKPVRNASIYFDGTLNGTTSDSSGNFTLYPQANKNVPVVISAVGYNTETIKELPSGKRAIVYLTIRQYDLEAVTISASDGMSRKEKLRIFRKEFLGTSANARSCEIVNEDDIKLSYNSTTKTIKAFSDKPIIVRNRKLGYTLNFLPKDLTFSPERVVVQGYQFFEEDPSRSGGEKIQKDRESTYLGSQIHFVRSLWNNDLKRNGFKIFRDGHQIIFNGSRWMDNDRRLITYDSIIASRDNKKYIHLEGGPVYIDYKGRMSYVNTLDSVGEGLISNNGHSDPAALVWSGFIGTQRVGDALPLEYKMADHTRPVKDTGVKNIIASADTAGIHGIISSMDTLRSRMPAEKLYIQFDKPYYSTGDTIWLKAYLLDAAFLTPSKSGVLYLELANDTNKVLMRRMMPVMDGLGRGNIVLDKEEIPEGSYTIRAYTNLMRNFGEDRVYTKSFYVSGSSAQSWLVNSKVSLSSQAGKDNLHLDLQFNKLNKENLGMHEMEFRVRDGRRVLLRDKVQTDVEGKVDVNFNLPEKVDPANISLVVTDPKKRAEDQKITIPLPINRPENTDLQFMPEGGNLVAGISSVVGFKAISEDGKGLAVSGKIFNGIQEVTVFTSSYKGMGSFEITPKEGESYTAKVVLNGIEKSFPLPLVKNSGTCMRVTNTAESDSIEVALSASSGVTVSSYYLTAQSRGIICYAAIIRFNGNNRVTKKVDKNLFPSGIARFTLLSMDRQPLNERLTFISHDEDLNITVVPGAESYKTRDSIALAVEVRDQEGKPVQGSFSLSVTDNNQVKVDSLGSNIITSLLLSSDLKGNIEDPMHYLDPAAGKDLNNLLLTQGWIGYDWKEVFNPPVPQFKAEPEFVVHGTVTNVFNKPVASVQVQLFSTKPGFATTGLTNSDGTFNFSGFPVADSLTLFLQTKNKKSKSFNVGITVDEFKPPVFKTIPQRFMPWYVNSDTSLLKYIKTVVEKKQEEIKLSGNVLGSVTITAKKIIKYSKNLNGPGESDFAIEEKEVLKAGKVTLNDLLLSKILGFREKEGAYVIQGLITHLIVDGIDIEWDGGRKKLVPPAEDLEEYFNNIDAADIKGIEVMTTPKYQYRYKYAYLHDPLLPEWNPLMSPVKHAWIEVTTRGGQGIFQKKKTGIFVHRPMPFTGPKQFYSPKYAVKSPLVLTDLRSTIYWEPDVITDTDGKAVVSFYSADRPGTYSVILEGSDMNGNIGRQRGTISIK